MSAPAMHFFSADGKYVVFYDAFGLTSLELPGGKLRTDKGLSGTWFSCNGDFALLHSARRNQRHARSVPDLNRAKFPDACYDLSYSHTAVLADGKRAALGNYDGELAIYSLTTGREDSRVKLAAGKKLAPFSLGPRLDPYVRTAMTFVGTDDSFAVFSPNDATLYGGRIAKKGIEAPWAVKCGLPQGRVTAKPHASGTFVAAWHPALDRSFCAVVRDGKAETRGVDTISPATWSGDAIVFQPLPGEVVRETLAGEAERFELPAGTHGAGELMANGATLLFITPDRERVVDVTTGAVFDRKLGASLLETRNAFINLERRFNDLGRAGNLLVELSCLELPAYGREHRPSFQWNDGDVGFLRLAVSAWLVHSLRVEENGRWSLGSYSNPQSIRPIDAKELVRDFEAMDEGGIELVPALAFLQSVLEDCYGGSFSEGKKVKVKKPMEKDAEQLLLWAVIEQLGSKKRVALAKGAAKWAKQKLTPQVFVKKLDPRDQSDAWADAQSSIAWLVLDFFGANAVPVFVDWLVARPSPFAKANPHIITDAPRRMMTQFPETKKKLLAAVDGALKKAKGEQLRYLEDLKGRLAD